jgi:hypothetical protein
MFYSFLCLFALFLSFYEFNFLADISNFGTASTGVFVNHLKICARRNETVYAVQEMRCHEPSKVMHRCE